MKIITTISEMRQWSEQSRCQGNTIGFVPTMGALHQGHLSLIQTARDENDLVVCSIFVNPTQFGVNEDLDTYPRPFEEDVRLLESESCDVLFYPSVEEMYGKNTALTFVSVENLPNHLCGLSRPGHFRGVTTVVSKLFLITLPHRAYFGRKDYQQLVIIQKMVIDLNFFVKIVACPIVRETDGLAMSSRNKYLSSEERGKASVLYESLQLIQQKLHEGENRVAVLIKLIEQNILAQVPESRVDYINIVDPNTLDDLKTIDREAVAALAVYFGKTRLIDNLLLKKN